MLKKNKFKDPIVRFMRIAFIYMVNVLIFAQLSIAASSYGQRVLEKNLSVNAENETLKKTLSKISEAADIKFVYSTNTISLDDKVSYNFSNENLKEILDQLLLTHSIDYVAREDGYIVLVPLKPKTREEEQKPDNSEEKQEEQQPEDLIKVHGIVYNEDGRETLAGANVVIKENRRGTVTDKNGEFVLWVRKDWHLQVSFIGFQSTELEVKGEQDLKIRLTSVTNSIDEVVVASNGLQNIPKERSPGSFTTVSADDLKEIPSLNVINSMESMIPGMQVSVLSGDRTFTYNITEKSASSATRTVGATEYNISIRGRGTLSGENFPLIVVDGSITEMDISSINPDDIENITVLKDASAASIWGVRAANGVIVITTKKGKSKQAPQVNFSTSLMIAEKPDVSYVKTMNSAQMLDYEKELVDRGFVSKIDASDYYSAQYTISKGSQLAWNLKSGNITEDEYNDDVAALSKTDNRGQISKYLLQHASSQNYNLSVSGGAENYNYYYSASYSKENPNSVRDLGERYTITANNNWKLFNLVNLATSFKGTFFSYKNNGISLATLYSPSRSTLLPYNQLADEDGNGISYDRYDQTWVSSLEANYKDWTYNYLDELKNSDNSQKTDNYSANIELTVPIIKGLTGSVKYAKEKTNSTSKTYYNQDTYYFRDMVNYYTYPGASTNSLGITTGGILSKGITYENNYSLRGQLNFNRIFKQDHQITALAGTEIRETNIGQTTFSLFGYNPETGLTNTSINYSSTPTYQYVAGDSETSYTTFYYGGYPSQKDKKRRFLSWYSNFAYDYKSKYFLSGSIRYDDYNNFGVERKYRATPLWSAGGKWMMSQEPFMKNLKWISNLGIRTTYGVNGNLSLDTYPFTYISLGGNSDSTTGQEYASVISTANPEIKWEKVYVTNLGVDFGLFNNRLNGTFDYYRKNSKDLLYNYPVSSAYVGNINSGYLTRNMASMKSTGFDFGLKGTLYNDKNWNWQMRFNLSYNTNKITDARFRETSYTNYYSYYPAGIGLIKGYPYDKLLVYRFAGLDENGLTQVYDKNGNIIPATTTSISDFIFKKAGRTVAPFFGSWNTTIRYKNISLFTLLTYQFGNVFLKPSIYGYTTSAYSVNYDISADIAKRWKKSGDESTTNVPGLNGSGSAIYYSQMRYNYSDVNVLKGDYVRLRQITLNYKLPSDILKRINIKNAQVGLTVNNLGLLWRANKQGYDPDFVYYPGRASNLPAAKSFLFSLNVNF